MNPIILHIDFNSFFASVEQQANPFLRGKPIAVAGKGKNTPGKNAFHRTVVTTASKEAKAMGVKTGMSSTEAKQVCPELIIIPGDPKKYSEITKRFLKLLKKYSDSVEQFSTDEAFADISIAAKDYFGAVFLAQQIRNEVKEQCGEYCTASIGIGPNKLIAKLACESMKPNGLTVVKPEDLTSFVASQPLNAICGIGQKIEQRLANLGITTTATLQKITLPFLEEHFKQYGKFLYLASRGLGDNFVNSEEIDPKSIGHSYTFARDLINKNDIYKNLLALCDKVAYRMRRDNFTASHLSIFIRYKKFNSTGTQKQFNEPIQDGLDLCKNAWHLINKIRNPEEAIRLIGISASNLQKNSMPKSLFRRDEKMKKVLNSLDKIEKQYGSNSWKRATTLYTLFQERTSGWHYDHEI